MNNHYTKALALASILAVASSPAFGQSRSGISSMIDNRLTTKFNPPPADAAARTNLALSMVPDKMFAAPKTGGEQQQGEEAPRLWADRNVSVGYIRRAQESKRRSDPSDKDTDLFRAGAYFENTNGFGINPTFEYATADSDGARKARGESDSFTPGLALGQDVFKFFRRNVDPFNVVLLADGAYSWLDSKARSVAGVRTKKYGDSWTAGVGLALGYTVIEGKKEAGSDTPVGKLGLTVTPAYHYTKEEDDTHPGSTWSSGELASLEGRLDYALTKTISLVLVSTWNHDLSASVPRSQPNERTHDSADFLFQPALSIGGNWKLRASVGYEAFHPDRDSIRGGLDLFYIF